MCLPLSETWTHNRMAKGKSTFSMPETKLQTPITLKISVQLDQHNWLPWIARHFLDLNFAFFSETAVRVIIYLVESLCQHVAFASRMLCTNYVKTCFCTALDWLCQFWSWTLTATQYHWIWVTAGLGEKKVNIAEDSLGLVFRGCMLVISFHLFSLILQKLISEWHHSRRTDTYCSWGQISMKDT